MADLLPDELSLTPDDLARDLEAERRAPALLAGLARPARPVRTRGASPAPPPPTLAGPGGVGRELSGRLPPDSQLRYRTLIDQEAKIAPDSDRGILIVYACQFLEGELRRLLADRLLHSDLPLRESLDPDRHAIPRDIIDKWRQPPRTTTFVTLSTLLFALRQCVEPGRPGRDRALTFLGRTFEPAFLDLVRGAKLEQCLESIRKHYRNPAAHGERTFTQVDYTDFVRLAVSSSSFRDWDSKGPTPAEPDPGRGVLHHLLRLARSNPDRTP
jgi:hypothetical protein